MTAALPLDDRRLAEITARSEAATPGPWGWGGLRRGPIYLATRQWGRCFVMGFARQGMNGAQPMFQVWDDKTGPDPASWSGRMTDASDLVVQQVDYREDIARIDHPDAEFIAQAREDIPALLAEVARLAGVAEAREEALRELAAAVDEERRWATGTAEHNDARTRLYAFARAGVGSAATETRPDPSTTGEPE